LAQRVRVAGLPHRDGASVARRVGRRAVHSSSLNMNPSAIRSPFRLRLGPNGTATVHRRPARPPTSRGRETRTTSSGRSPRSPEARTSSSHFDHRDRPAHVAKRTTDDGALMEPRGCNR
jgi:hypothetical protein